MSQPGLELRGLKHAYGRSPVLRGVDLDVHRGRVHALLGPNGAGKSTLISCLSGVLRPQAGSIRLGAVDLAGRSPAAVRHLGVSVIYQSFSLVDGLSVADNIFLGDELRRGPFVSRRRQAIAAAALFEELGAPVNPGRPVGSLSVGEQQMVEIAKAVHGQVKFLVLDEPTAALGKSETDALLALVRRLTDAGVGVVYISHHLDEVMQIGDDVTVLRDGVVVDSGQVSGYTATRLLSAIAPSAPAATSSSVVDVGAERLRVDSLEVDGVGPISFSVGIGEVVALFGLLGSGRTEVLEAVAGARRRTGTVTLGGEAVAPGSVASCVRRGICFVPADRRHGIFEALSAQQNLLAPHHRSLARWGLRQIGRERQCFDTVAGQLALEPPDPSKPAWASPVATRRSCSSAGGSSPLARRCCCSTSRRKAST